MANHLEVIVSSRLVFIWAALVVALVACGRSDSPTDTTARFNELPQGCNTEPYVGEFGESGEPAQEAGSGRTWYQGSDGRWYNCPSGNG